MQRQTALAVACLCVELRRGRCGADQAARRPVLARPHLHGNLLRNAGGLRVRCRAVPCRAVPCRAVPCRAVPCRASSPCSLWARGPLGTRGPCASRGHVAKPPPPLRPLALRARAGFPAPVCGARVRACLPCGQPVPNPAAPLLHALPAPVLAGGVVLNHVAELVAPFLLVMSRGPCAVGGAIQLAFQFSIVVGGNLAFLNWLTVGPTCVARVCVLRVCARARVCTCARL